MRKLLHQRRICFGLRRSRSSLSDLLALLLEMPTISMPRAPSRGLAKALPGMTMQDDDFNPRPGRVRHGNQGAKRPKSFAGEVMRAAKKAGHRGRAFGQSGGAGGRSTFGRGRRAALSLAARLPSRRVVVMARVVRHRGGRLPSAPLSKHVAYLKREGVTRDGAEARMFDATSDDADTPSAVTRSAFCDDQVASSTLRDVGSLSSGGR
jgi:hypothetical protein